MAPTKAETTIIPSNKVLEDNKGGVGMSGYYVIQPDGSHYKVSGKEYVISKREYTLLVKGIKEAHDRKPAINTQDIVAMIAPQTFLNAIEESNPEVYNSLYEHLTKWYTTDDPAIKSGAVVAKTTGPAPKTPAEKLASILISLAPALAPEQLMERLEGMVKEHREEAIKLVQEMEKKNGRDGNFWIYTSTKEKRDQLAAYKKK